ncbi:HAD-like protein [Apiospora aurea]|uniref:HAD-like protein n=1 Tax=Apiospora aurea TaxID=335848 RepID=A0ABR1QQK5_9PEZI
MLTGADWERGFSAPLYAITSQLPPMHPYRKQGEEAEGDRAPVLALQRFAELVSGRERAQPDLLYNELLVECASALASELGITTLSDGAAEPFGNAPGTWDAFPDSVPGLQRLARAGRGLYKLCCMWRISGGGRDDIHGDEEEEFKGRTAHEWRFDTIEQLAEEVERQFAVKQNVK